MSTEIRLRIFHAADDTFTADESPVQQQQSTNNNNDTGNIFSLESLSSSAATLTGSAALSSTIIEEEWTPTAFTAIHLLRITSASFEYHPFLDPSYGKNVTKLSFGGPCCTEVIYKALETFPAVTTLEFGPGYFMNGDDFDEDHLSPKTFPRINSLSVNCDAHKYFKLEETDQEIIHLKITCLLYGFFVVDGWKSLDYVSLSLPNTDEIETFLNLEGEDFLRRGVAWVDATNRQVS